MERLICIQYSIDFFCINICDFKATHEQVIFQDLNLWHLWWWQYISCRMWCHFYQWMVTNILEELAASETTVTVSGQHSIVSEKTQIVKRYFVISYHISCNNIFLLIKGQPSPCIFLLWLLWHTANVTSHLTVKHTELQCFVSCQILVKGNWNLCHNWVFYLSHRRLKLGGEFSFSWHLLWTFNTSLLLLTLPGYTYPDRTVMGFFYLSRIVCCYRHGYVIWYSAVSRQLLVPMYLSHRQTHMAGRAVMRHSTWKRNVLIQDAEICKIHHTTVYQEVCTMKMVVHYAMYCWSPHLLCIVGRRVGCKLNS
jgi:hypothetical protein